MPAPLILVLCTGNNPFPDPATGTEEEQLAGFRRVRDAIAQVMGAYADGRLDQAGAGRS